MVSRTGRVVGRRHCTDLGRQCAVVDLPPSLDEVVRCVLRGVGPRGEDDCVHLRQVAMLPRLDGTNEVDYLRISTKSGKERERERKRCSLVPRPTPFLVTQKPSLLQGLGSKITCAKRRVEG